MSALWRVKRNAGRRRGFRVPAFVPVLGLLLNLALAAFSDLRSLGLAFGTALLGGVVFLLFVRGSGGKRQLAKAG